MARALVCILFGHVRSGFFKKELGFIANLHISESFFCLMPVAKVNSSWVAIGNATPHQRRRQILSSRIGKSSPAAPIVAWKTRAADGSVPCDSLLDVLGNSPKGYRYTLYEIILN